jgi:hypothetical protein
MRPSDIQTYLQEAITLAQSGQRIEARRRLERIVEADPRQETAWLWLATIATQRQERINFLERALAINPRNHTAQEAYAQLTGQVFTPSALVSSAGSPSDIAGFVRFGLIFVTLAVLLVMAAFVISGQLANDDQSSARSIPTLRPVDGSVPALRQTSPPQAQPQPNQPNPQNVIPTITDTPYPTRTPGPSPTSIWDAPPPTWTVVASSTPAPTRTPAPSSTPHPTATSFVGPYFQTATAAFALTSDAGPATVAFVRTQAALTPSP